MLTWTSSRLSSNFRPTNPNRITPNRTINHRNCFRHFSIFFLSPIPSKLHRFKLRFQSRLVISLLSKILPTHEYAMHTSKQIPKLFDNYIYTVYSITQPTNARIVSISITIILLSYFSFSVSGSNRVAKFPRRSRSRKLGDSVFAEGIAENTSTVQTLFRYRRDILIRARRLFANLVLRS